jgi:hypothetical protein
MAEKRTIELEIQDNSKSLKAQYKEAVQELQRVSAAYGETSAEAVKAARAAAELKDQIGFSKDLVDSFNPDAKFNSLTKSFGGVLDGFQAFEGALGLVGVEGEAVQKTMLKVQSAMALSQGLQGLGEARDSFKQLGVVAVNAFKGIKGAIAATGIGLLLVAVGTLYAYWDDIKEAVSGVSEEQTKLNKKTEANLKVAQEKVDSLNKQDNILRLQGKTEKQILEMKIKELDATIAIAETNLANQKATKKAQYEAAKANKDILMGIINFLNKPLKFLLETVDAVGKAMGENFNLTLAFSKQENDFANMFFNPDAINTEGDAAIKEAENKLIELKDQRAGYVLAIRNIEQQGANNSRNDANTNAKEKLDLERENTDRRISLMADGYDKEVALATERAKREKEDLLKNSKDKIVDKQQLADAEKLIDANLKKDLRNLDIKYNSEKLLTWEEKNKKEIEQRQIEFDAEMEAAGKRIAIREAEAEKKKQIDKEEIERRNELRQKTLQLAGDTFSALGNLAGSFNTKNEKDARKQFQVQKAFNLAAAITNTAMAVTGALTAGGNPIKLATGMQFVEAGIAATVGAANIIKISNSKFGGGANSGGGGNDTNVPTAAPMTANFNTIGSSGINQLAQLQQTPTQAYVVSGEVTSAQALDRNRVQNATL